MPMKMGWRWYGEGNDPITSATSRFPGVTASFGEAHNKMPAIWEIDEMKVSRDQIHAGSRYDR